MSTPRTRQDGRLVVLDRAQADTFLFLVTRRPKNILPASQYKFAELVPIKPKILSDKKQ